MHLTQEVADRFKNGEICLDLSDMTYENLTQLKLDMIKFGIDVDKKIKVWYENYGKYFKVNDNIFEYVESHMIHEEESPILTCENGIFQHYQKDKRGIEKIKMDYDFPGTIEFEI